MIAWTIYISFVGAALLAFLPGIQSRTARLVAMGTALAGFGVSLVAAFAYDPASASGTLQMVTRVSWIPRLGIQYHLGADGISVVLVVLTAMASVAGVLFSWNVEHRTREFFALYFLLIGSVYGVFLSVDLFLLFVFYELAIIPKYFLIAIWGSTRKEYGAMKLVLYSFFGSALVLAGLLAAYVIAGVRTFDLLELSRFAFPVASQKWLFPLMFVGFAVLAGLWPLHTWAPTGHVAAPTAASMLLAGIVMKLGAYGAMRVAMVLFPAGLEYWRMEIAILAIAGIVLGAGIALVQRDFKFVIGYSSVSHMGFVLLGLAAMNVTGISGAVLQMFSHGLLAGLLFAVVGRMVYDRTHTRDFAALRSMNLGDRLPFAAGVFAIAAFAAIGLPGFSGFVAELQVLVGAWEFHPTAAVLAGLGILVGAAYTLRALDQTFLAGRVAGPAGDWTPAPISVPERAGAFFLLAGSLLIGLYPRLVLDLIVPSLGSPWMQPLTRGGGL